MPELNVLASYSAVSEEWTTGRFKIAEKGRLPELLLQQSFFLQVCWERRKK